MKPSEKVSEVNFKYPNDDRVSGIVVNPGGYFGNVWIIQIAIANALNPFFAVEASSEQDAIDEFADSRYSHLIDVDEEDCPKFIVKDGVFEDGEYEETDYTQAGNDSHWVDLTNVYVNKAPSDIEYYVKWKPDQDELSSVIDSELNLIREEKEAEKKSGK